MRTICIIPARGGSKRIPRKNIRPFCGKPIIAYSIEAALKSSLFVEVMVSTDDPEIAAVAREYGASVPHLREPLLADDFTGTDEVILAELGRLEKQGNCYDAVCCLYSTAPFVTSDSLKKAHAMLSDGEHDSSFAMVRFAYPIDRALIEREGMVTMRWPEHLLTRSQDLPVCYHDAGQYYFATVEALKRYKGFWGERTGGVELEEIRVQDLDTEADWQMAEFKYRYLQKKLEI